MPLLECHPYRGASPGFFRNLFQPRSFFLNFTPINIEHTTHHFSTHTIAQPAILAKI